MTSTRRTKKPTTAKLYALPPLKADSPEEPCSKPIPIKDLPHGGTLYLPVGALSDSRARIPQWAALRPSRVIVTGSTDDPHWPEMEVIIELLRLLGATVTVSAPPTLSQLLDELWENELTTAE